MIKRNSEAIMMLVYLLVSFFPLQAQNNRFKQDVQTAKSYFDQRRYYTAIQVYKEIEPMLRPQDRYDYAVCLAEEAKSQTTYRNVYFAETVRQLQLASKNGHTKAKSWLAELFVEGKYTPQNNTEALQLLSNACASNNPKAMYLNASYLNEGSITKRDSVQAYRWMQRAAEKNFPEALLELGNWHYQGKGAVKDLAKAEYYWKMAGEAGLMDGMYNYAYLLLTTKNEVGNGIKKLNEASNLGHMPSRYMLGTIYTQGLFNTAVDSLMAETFFTSIVRDNSNERNYPDMYRESLLYLRTIGAKEPVQDSKQLRAGFDRIFQQVREAGTSAALPNTTAMYKKLNENYQGLSSLGFKPGKISKRLKGDSKTDAEWLKKPYHIYETRIMHHATSDAASAAFLRWNRLLQKMYPEATITGTATHSSLEVQFPDQDKISIELEWDQSTGNNSDEIRIRLIYYRLAKF